MNEPPFDIDKVLFTIGVLGITLGTFLFVIAWWLAKQMGLCE